VNQPQLSSVRWSGVLAGYAATFVLTSLPVLGLRAWVGLNEYARWSYSDLSIAVLVLAITVPLARRSSHARALPLLMMAVAGLIAVSECAYVVGAVRSPMSDNLISAAINFLGFWFLLGVSAAGLVLTLWSAPYDSRKVG
jgi:hypothetical protein